VKTTQEKIDEAIDNLTEAARNNGQEMDVVTNFLLNHLSAHAEYLAALFDDEHDGEDESESPDKEDH
jgi:hypothetical protein